MSSGCCRALLGPRKKPLLEVSLPIKQQRQIDGERLWAMVPLRTVLLGSITIDIEEAREMMESLVGVLPSGFQRNAAN